MGLQQAVQVVQSNCDDSDGGRQGVGIRQSVRYPLDEVSPVVQAGCGVEVGQPVHVLLGITQARQVLQRNDDHAPLAGTVGLNQLPLLVQTQLHTARDVQAVIEAEGPGSRHAAPECLADGIPFGRVQPGHEVLVVLKRSRIDCQQYGRHR